MILRTVYTFVTLIVCLAINAQTIQFQLEKAGLHLFGGKLYVFGFVSQEKKSAFRIYKLGNDLQPCDSLDISLGKTMADVYLQVASDTLHNYLNIYLQKKEKKAVHILRFDRSFKLSANIENVDIARLNSISDFENELFYCKNELYTVKNQKDSSGLQFYLNKYTLRSETKNFEYAFTWQFPFERKNINSAHIFYADRRSVMLYVNLTGHKPGQWILNINAASGKLIRGTKLNSPGDQCTYQFGNFIVDTLTHALSFIGQKLSDRELKQGEKRLQLSGAVNCLVYMSEIDSLGELTDKLEFKIPVTEAKPQPGEKPKPGKVVRAAVGYILRIPRFSRERDGRIIFEADIFKTTDNAPCFFYSNSTRFVISQGEEGPALEKNSISPNPLVENFYLSNDKIDMSGKLCVDSLREFEKLYYKNLTFPVKQQFKTRSDGDARWILGKSNIKKNTINFSYLIPEKKIYAIALIDELPRSSNPVFVALRPDLFIIASQADELTFTLKAYTW